MTRNAKGVFAAVLTPLTVEGRVDHASLVTHCRWLLGQGCDGLLILGTTGEANSLSMEERLAILDALAAADDLSPRALLIGTGCCAAPDTVRLTRAALQLGAAGVVMLPPFYYKPPAVSDDGLVAYYTRVIEDVGDAALRVYLYRFPQLTGLAMGLSFVQRLHAAFPETVVGIKDSSGDWEQMAALLEALPGFAFFTGTERLLLPTLRAGGAGCISATVNVLAPQVADLYRAWREGEVEEAGQLQERVADLRALIQPHPLAAALKGILAHWTGDPCWSTIRPPLMPLSPDDAAALGDRIRNGITGS